MVPFAFLAAALTLIAPLPAFAATITEIFVMLPPEQVRDLTPVDRRALIDNHGQGASGYTAPDANGYWLEIHGTHSLTLFGIRDAPISYKVFPTSKGWQLLAICRSRQTYGPANANELPHESFLDLTLYSVSATNDLLTADVADYLPEISVWDFVTRDTVTDKNAFSDLKAINQVFDDCLTCHSSVEDSSTIDIVTVTSINGHSCAYLLPQFKLLPLRWVGDRFTKPYDRAALPGPDRPKAEPRHGIYYHEPGK
ncbi:MAG: hypothetical protein LBF58_08930 [Deltaproteobacteria bacterium]|nr:hypothetical protein [Deltaproteobacteria bacterium]